MPNTVNKEVIKVHGVNPKPFVKGGKTISAGGLLVDPDRKIWVNVAPELDMKVFQKNESYEVAREILENGKSGNIIAVEGYEETRAGSSTGSNGQKQGLDRDTRITLMNVGNVAANIVSGSKNGIEFLEVFETVKTLYKKEGLL